MHITLTNNMGPVSDIFDPSLTLRQVMDSKSFSYASGILMIDGCAIGLGDIDKKMSDLHAGNTPCFVTCVVKADSAC